MSEDESSEEQDTVYDEDGREDMVSDEELSPEEEGFMKGYDEAEQEDKDDEVEF